MVKAIIWDIFLAPKWMYILRSEFQRWEEHCSGTAACGEEQSLFLISISASHCPPLLLCLQTNESQKNLRQECCFIEKLAPFFPLCIFSFCPPPSVSLIFGWKNAGPLLQMIVSFENLQLKRKQKFVCFQTGPKGEVFVGLYYLQPGTRLKAERRDRLCF